jgi:hypothetical protein
VYSMHSSGPTQQHRLTKPRVLSSPFDHTYFSFSTLFANGVALDTGSIEESPRLARVNQSKTFRAVFVPQMTVAEAYRRHEEEIVRIETSFRTRALAFRPEQFATFSPTKSAFSAIGSTSPASSTPRPRRPSCRRKPQPISSACPRRQNRFAA